MNGLPECICSCQFCGLTPADGIIAPLPPPQVQRGIEPPELLLARRKDPSGTISERIRQARRQAELDPAALRLALSERGIDLSKTGLHRLETTEPRNPNLMLIEAIAEITNVSPGWILFGKGPAVPEGQVGNAIRGRVIDTIELMSGALDMTKQQQSRLDSWLKSMRETKPRQVRKP